MGESSISLATTLNEIASRLETQLSAGQSLDSALDADARLSNSYRTALDIWLNCDGSPVALESLVSKAASLQQSRRILQLSILQPLVILVMGYFSLIYICSITIPKFESLCDQVQHAPGIGLSIMIAVRKTMVYWVPLAPPAILGLLIYFRQRTRDQAFKGLWFDRFAIRQLANAVTSEQMAERVRYDALESATDPSLPPLLKWAGEDTAPSQSSQDVVSNRLRIAAAMYRMLASMRTQFSLAWLPLISLCAIGGLLVLGLGLSVFVPMVELLTDIARSH